MNLIRGVFFKLLLVTILLLFFTELTKSILNIDDLLYNSLSEKLTLQQIKDLFDFQDKWKWLGYVFIPIYLLLKTAIIATVLYIGSYFFVAKDILFKSFWEIVINAEFFFYLFPFLNYFGFILLK